MFGNGQRTCKVCGKHLDTLKTVRIEVRHSSGAVLSALRYHAPLCEEHRGNNSLAIQIEWDDEIPIQETLGE
jgi:hypothetical protein